MLLLHQIYGKHDHVLMYSEISEKRSTLTLMWYIDKSFCLLFYWLRFPMAKFFHDNDKTPIRVRGNLEK